jgi:hypothetical protein
MTHFLRQPILWLALALTLSAPAAARGVYLAPAKFIHSTFGQEIKPQVIWLSKELQQGIKQILGHPYPALRLRYWREGTRSAWILEEIGKEKPITFGIVIKQGRIEQFHVLEFRESRGSEIRYPFFTDQFVDLRLDGMQLSDDIDGISGATLSVRTGKKMARLALYLHQQITGTP